MRTGNDVLTPHPDTPSPSCPRSRIPGSKRHGHLCSLSADPPLPQLCPVESPGVVQEKSLLPGSMEEEDTGLGKMGDLTKVKVTGLLVAVLTGLQCSVRCGPV